MSPGPSKVPPVVIAGLIGIVSGAASALAAGATLELNAVIGFWGSVYGLLGGTASFGFSLLLLTRRESAIYIGGFLTALPFTLYALAVGWWILETRVSPLTLEGAWMWPSTIGSVAAVCATARWTVARGRRRRHDRTPDRG